MRIAHQGNGALPLGVPLVPDRAAAPAAEQGNLRVPGSRSGDTWYPSGPPRPATAAAEADKAVTVPADADEVLIADSRAGISPAEMVERKLRSLLRSRGISIQTASTMLPVRGRFPR